MLNTPHMTYPCSAYDLTGGLTYFARMLDKIRLHDAGELPEDYHPNIGKGMDARCCRYLGVDYAKLAERVLTGGTDEEILHWCIEQGRKLTDVDILVWNGFSMKRGWRDPEDASAFLVKAKAASGLSDRDDIQTLFDYFDVDEKRKP